MPDRGIVEELAMAPLRTPQKGNRNRHMLMSEKKSKYSTQNICIYPNVSRGTVAFIYVMRAFCGLQDAAQHFRSTTDLTPFGSGHRRPGMNTH